MKTFNLMIDKKKFIRLHHHYSKHYCKENVDDKHFSFSCPKLGKYYSKYIIKSDHLDVLVSNFLVHKYFCIFPEK